VNFLLDTNVCIALINGNSETVRKRFDRALAARNQLFVSSVAMFELWYGVFKSTRVQFNSDRLDAFLEGSVTILSFDEDDARAAGSLNAALKLSGQLIGSYDILIAGQAMHKNLTLVTADVSEFSRVKGLSWQDWARA
jgi:tRNA(fMet)-specific endonuclease VapC